MTTEQDYSLQDGSHRKQAVKNQSRELRYCSHYDEIDMAMLKAVRWGDRGHGKPMIERLEVSLLCNMQYAEQGH